MKRYDIAIIGAGTAGLSARREVAKRTNNYVVIDDGILGTTCARVGCMPSKALIETANLFHKRHTLKKLGVGGAHALDLDRVKVMSHVRQLRDRFVRSVTKEMDDWTETHLIKKRAKFTTKNTLDLGDEVIHADKIIVATGSKPVWPKGWEAYSDYLVDTDSFFELETFPSKVAVIGLGVIGLELGQSLARIGVDVVGIGLGNAIGGLTDPEIQTYAIQKFGEEFPIVTTGVKELRSKDGKLEIITSETSYLVDKALLALGRKPSLAGLGLDELGLELDDKGIPLYDPGTYLIEGTSIFIAGDVNPERPILHEAADEGRIAGYNAASDKMQCFRRRTKLAITFADPNIAIVGKSYDELHREKVDFVTGKVSYEGQGRAILKMQEIGMIHVYVDRNKGSLLGAEIFCPDGEHMAHLLAWAIAGKIDVHHALSMPFYHPVIEEGLRTALRHAASLVEVKAPVLETMRCQDPPVGVFANGK
jgi:dihydrolipoamide dehydrogenase